MIFRLELKGYKRDLKKAQAKIESLQATALQPPPTPDEEEVPSVERWQHRRPTDTPVGSHPGLGISFSGPAETQTRSVAYQGSPALLGTSPQLPSSTVTGRPPTRARTPMGIHKRLPKPPPSPKPPSNFKVQRTETLRSLSESIISSYAKRPTPEQGSESTPVSRDRCSEPLGTLGSPIVPSTHFAAEKPAYGNDLERSV